MDTICLFFFIHISRGFFRNGGRSLKSDSKRKIIVQFASQPSAGLCSIHLIPMGDVKGAHMYTCPTYNTITYKYIHR